MQRLILLLITALTFAACTKNEVGDPSNNRNDLPEGIIVSFEDSGNTRIQLDNSLKTVWNSGDEVSVFYLSDANQKWQYQGEDGERIGVLHCIDAGTATVETTRVVAIYPYNTDYVFNPETYSIQATLPAVQSYKQDSYGANANIMVSSGECNHISLKSACGWFKLQLTGSGEKVQSITLRGNNDEMVAGALLIDSSDATATLTSTMSNEVILDCGEGVELGAESTSFYIAVPPQTFEQGITVEVECDNGTSTTKSTSEPITIERNHIKPMEAIEYDGVLPEVYELAYRTNDGKKLDPLTTNGFGGEFEENIFDAATGEGKLVFAGAVTAIPDNAFGLCENLTWIDLPLGITSIGASAFSGCSSMVELTIPASVASVGEGAFSNCTGKAYINCNMPNGSYLSKTPNCFRYAGFTEVIIGDSVTTIGFCAFYDCDSLTSVTIGDSVTTIGGHAFYDCDNLTSVTIGDSVTTIGDWAFYHCDSLTSITIPDSVTTIGDDVFLNCDNLTSVTIGDSVTTIGRSAFSGCDSLTSITIPDSVTTIEEAAFDNCTNLVEFNGKFASEDGRCLIVDGTLNSFAPAGLTSYTIPDSVTRIGDWAFEDCDSLTSITIPDSVTTIGRSSFSWCDSLTSVTIGDSVTTIGYSAFYCCYSLTSVYCEATTPPSLNGSVFYNNASGRTIYVPEESVRQYKIAEYWSEYADAIIAYDFETGSVVVNSNQKIYYTATEKVTKDWKFDDFGANILLHEWNSTTGEGTIIFDTEISTIGEKAFYKCNSLTSITIPDGVITMGDQVFSSCDNLTSVTLGKYLTTISYATFSYCSKLTNISIPNNVTEIGNSAFRNCESLTSITIPDGVMSIGEYAFFSCHKLADVKIPNSVTSIKDGAFKDCEGLTDITIPDSVNSIGDEAFKECIKLIDIYCKATTPPSLGGSSVFDDNALGRSVYVLAESADAYRSAEYWNEYEIVGYDF